MINVPLPNRIEAALTALYEIARRAIDGTVVPLVVDYPNQRVLIGAAAAQASKNGKIEVTGGDARIVDAGKGIVVTTPDGTAQYRIRVNNAGAVVSEVV